MLTVYFDSVQEMIDWRTCLNDISRKAKIELTYNGPNAITLVWNPAEEGQFIYYFVEAFHRFIETYYLEKWLANIVTSKFFFEDEEEILQIVEISMMIWHENKNSEDVPFSKVLAGKTFAAAASQRLSFSVQSFLTFRLKDWLESFIGLIEMAIDEYKMEQDYQAFIHLLREFMKQKAPVRNQIHLLHSDDFLFFDEKFKPYTKQELSRSIDRKLMAENPIYIDSNTIAPLVSLAPQQLFLYTDQEENSIVLTIRRIFEERVQVEGIDQFYKKKGFVC